MTKTSGKQAQGQQCGTKNRWRHIAAALLLSLTSVSTLADTSLWKVSRDNQVLYLGGTIHVLRASDYPLPEAYQQAFDSADIVAFETDLRQINSSEFQQLLMTKARYPAGENLADHLSVEALQALQQYCDDSGISIEALLPFKPALAMLTMLSIELTRHDITGGGVDNYFLLQADTSGKTILGLETAEQQLDFIVSMGRDQESEFILHSLQDLQQLDQLLQQMIDAWRSGDTRSLDQLFVAPLAQQYPGMYQSMLLERNQAWLPKIEELLQTEATELVLVGVAHLVGDDGLAQQLVLRGYKVEQQ
jgi:uncharacterized protein YbaP (TraB family)